MCTTCIPEPTRASDFAAPSAVDHWEVIRRENRRRRVPRPECRDCHAPYLRGDGAWLFRGPLCGTCEAARLEVLLARAAGRLGRRKLIRALKKLGRK